ncbi:MAG: hypothetical protein KDC97_10115 [Confluentibacter sp.]|nr:hypothetical protein [Confluentibacter sp.]
MKRFQETKQDFGYQYIQFHDVLMKDYFNSIEKINPEFLKYKGCSIKGIIEKSIFAKFIYYQPLRDRFNEFWKNGGMPNHLKEQYYNDAYAEFIHNEMELVAELKNEKDETKFDDKVKKKLENALDPCKGKIIYYAYNLRFLELALPILSKIPEEVIVLTYQDIPESSNYPENIMLVEFPVIKMRTCKNVFLKLKFPELYHLFYNLEMLLKIIEPKSIIILEGFNVVEYNILAVIGKAQKIKTVCVQHGWPGILYSGFHNMQFDYFLSWGKSFTNLLKPNNPDPKFITVGYPYSVPLKVQEKNSISFFFQGPYFVSTSAVIEEMISFAIFCATTFPEFDILLREHPTSTIRTKRMDLLNSFENIKFVSHNKISLSDVLM